MAHAVYEIDGGNIQSLADFFRQVWPLLANLPPTHTNLDAFNDILSWPEEPYTLVWKASQRSRERLGHAEMAKTLSEILERCHPSNVLSIKERLARARRGDGPTMFDWLVEIIRGNEPHVTLRLE